MGVGRRIHDVQLVKPRSSVAWVGPTSGQLRANFVFDFSGPVVAVYMGISAYDVGSFL